MIDTKCLENTHVFVFGLRSVCGVFLALNEVHSRLSNKNDDEIRQDRFGTITRRTPSRPPSTSLLSNSLAL
jgi:hypothetical protein